MSAQSFGGTFCVVCEKSYGPDLRRCCTAGSVLAFRGSGKSRSYFSLDGVAMSSCEVETLANIERIKKQEGMTGTQATRSYYATSEELAQPPSAERYPAGLFSFDGRIGRIQFLKIQAGLLLPGMVASHFLDITKGFEILLALPFLLPLVLMNVASFVKRLHDVGHSGLVFLVSITGIGGLLLLLYLLIAQGTQGPNEYGLPSD